MEKDAEPAGAACCRTTWMREPFDSCSNSAMFRCSRRSRRARKWSMSTVVIPAAEGNPLSALSTRVFSRESFYALLARFAAR